MNKSRNIRWTKAFLVCLTVTTVILVGCVSRVNKTDDSTTRLAEPVILSDALKRNCQQSEAPRNFDSTGLAVGEHAVEFTLKDVNGQEYTLSEMLVEKPVVLVFGSYT